MIDVSNQIAAIQQLMELMEKYKIDEVSVDFICIKKSKHLGTDQSTTDKEVIDKHTQSLKNASQLRIMELQDWMDKGGI